MYKNLFTINLKEVARELRRHNVQFSMNGNMISVLPIQITFDKKIIGIYQGSNKILLKEDSNLCELANIVSRYNNIKKLYITRDDTSISGIQIIITRNDIVCMQNGRIL